MMRPDPRRLVLIGLRGSGKSTVGPIVAARLGRRFIDTDERVIARTGRSIAQLFAECGEADFRKREAREAVRALRTPNVVVSLGGGAVMTACVRAAIERARAACVWLVAAPEELARRIAAQPGSAGLRPALTPLAAADELSAVLAARRATYEALGHHRVDTTGAAPDLVADGIVAWLAGLRVENGVA